jgi:phosphoglycolate phosphatase-like HAD superfamily hydrolase
LVQPAIVLFDIDGTLISTGGVARSALVHSFAELMGATDDALDFSFGGMTDRAIMRLGLERIGHRADDETMERLLEHYLDRLERHIGDAPHYTVHAGMRETLESLTRHTEVAVGLGTGNVERGARIKLERGDLNRYFAFGGYGCDSEDRAALIAAGLARGAARLGCEVSRCRRVIIGDTPRDVWAAHANDARCIAVLTGGVSRAALAESGADAIFDDMAAPGAWEALWEL